MDKIQSQKGCTSFSPNFWIDDKNLFNVCSLAASIWVNGRSFDVACMIAYKWGIKKYRGFKKNHTVYEVRKIVERASDEESIKAVKNGN